MIGAVLFFAKLSCLEIWKYKKETCVFFIQGVDLYNFINLITINPGVEHEILYHDIVYNCMLFGTLFIFRK